MSNRADISVAHDQHTQFLVEASDRARLAENGESHLLVRCFNKARSDIDAFLQRTRDTIHAHAPLSSILFVVDRSAEQRTQKRDPSKYRDTLASIRDAEKYGFNVVPVQLWSPTPSWIPGLNAGVAYLQHEGVQDGQLITSSFDSVPKNPEALSQMSDSTVPFLSIRETPEQFVPDDAKEILHMDDSDLRQKMVQILHSTQQAYNRNEELPEDVVHQLIFLVRNTFGAWQLRNIIEVGGFDPHAGIAGGQEDTAMALQLFLANQALVTDGTPVVRYEDLRFQNATSGSASGKVGEGHDEKIQREIDATKLLWQRLRDTRGVLLPENRVFLA